MIIEKRVIRLGTIEMYPTLEEYARLLGVTCDNGLIITPPIVFGFKQRVSITIKKSALLHDSEAKES